MQDQRVPQEACDLGHTALPYKTVLELGTGSISKAMVLGICKTYILKVSV